MTALLSYTWSEVEMDTYWQNWERGFRAGWDLFRAGKMRVQPAIGGGVSRRGHRGLRGRTRPPRRERRGRAVQPLANGAAMTRLLSPEAPPTLPLSDGWELAETRGAKRPQGIRWWLLSAHVLNGGANDHGAVVSATVCLWARRRLHARVLEYLQGSRPITASSLASWVLCEPRQEVDAALADLAAEGLIHVSGHTTGGKERWSAR